MFSNHDRWKLRTPEEGTGLKYECPDCGELMRKRDIEDHTCKEPIDVEEA